MKSQEYLKSILISIWVPQICLISLFGLLLIPIERTEAQGIITHTKEMKDVILQNKVTYTFIFKIDKNKNFSIQESSSSYELAFEKAASKCVQQLRGQRNGLTEEEKLDIVDICANPSRA